MKSFLKHYNKQYSNLDRGYTFYITSVREQEIIQQTKRIRKKNNKKTSKNQ